MRVAGKAILLVSLTALTSVASEQPTPTLFDSFRLHSKTCSVIKPGPDGGNVVWKGRREHGLCIVQIERSEFESRYTHCALSGIIVDTDSPGNFCHFNHYDDEKTKVAFISSYVARCDFICIKPTSR